MAIKKYRLKVGQKHYVGGGAGAVCYKYPQTVELSDDQYKAFRDKFDPTENTAAELAKAAEASTPKFSLEDAGGKKWNVVNNETGSLLNEVPLGKREAQKIINEQAGETDK